MVVRFSCVLLQTSADYAEVLASCAGNADKSADVHNLLNFLGIKGEGLVDAIEHRPDIGHIFGEFALHISFPVMFWQGHASPLLHFAFARP